jgi:hypothetical protein
MACSRTFQTVESLMLVTSCFSEDCFGESVIADKFLELHFLNVLPLLRLF